MHYQFIYGFFFIRAINPPDGTLKTVLNVMFECCCRHWTAPRVLKKSLTIVGRPFLRMVKCRDRKSHINNVSRLLSTISLTICTRNYLFAAIPPKIPRPLASLLDVRKISPAIIKLPIKCVQGSR